MTPLAQLSPGGKVLSRPIASGRIEHMFEGQAGGDEPAEAVPEPAPPVTAAMLRCWIAGLARVDRRVDDAERVTQLELLERLKSAAAAAQAEVTVDFAASQRAGADRGGGAGRDGGGRGRRAGGAGPAGLPVPRRPLPGAGAGVDLGAAGHVGRAAGRGHLGVAGHPGGPGDRVPGPGRPPGRGRRARPGAGRAGGPGGGGGGPGGRLPAGPAGVRGPRPGRGEGPDGDVAAGAGHHVEVLRVPAGRPGRRHLRGAVRRGRPVHRRR